MQPSEIFVSTGACSCGQSLLQVQGKVLARFLCHCTICQGVYKAPFADVTALRGSSVRLSSPESVSYRRYRPPPALQRGTCVKCGEPVVGFMRIAPFMRFAFVPTRSLKSVDALPKPAAHIFYDRRRADAQDGLSTYSGYLPSELAVARLLLMGMLSAARRRSPLS